MPYRILGPKGKLIVKRATLARVRKLVLPLVKKYKRIQVTATPAPADRRAGIVAYCRWAIAHEPQIHYTQDSRQRMSSLGNTQRLPLYTDCSGFATYAYKTAGAPDPNGLGYNGTGYTGTLLQHMRHIPKSAVQPGDLVVWGPATGHHVAVVLEAGPDPLLASHGQERGPLAIHFSEESRYQPSPATFLTSLS